MKTQIALGLVLIMFLSVNITNSTSDCPENYYGDGYLFDLLDRGWCDDSDSVLEP